MKKENIILPKDVDVKKVVGFGFNEINIAYIVDGKIGDVGETIVADSGCEKVNHSIGVKDYGAKKVDYRAQRYNGFSTQHNEGDIDRLALRTTNNDANTLDVLFLNREGEKYLYLQHSIYGVNGSSFCKKDGKMVSGFSYLRIATPEMCPSPFEQTILHFEKSEKRDTIEAYISASPRAVISYEKDGDIIVGDTRKEGALVIIDNGDVFRQDKNGERVLHFVRNDPELLKKIQAQKETYLASKNVEEYNTNEENEMFLASINKNLSTKPVAHKHTIYTAKQEAEKSGKKEEVKQTEAKEEKKVVKPTPETKEEKTIFDRCL